MQTTFTREKDVLQNLPEALIKQILLQYSQSIVQNADKIIEQNALDLAKMDVSNPKYDRLLLNKNRVLAIAADVAKIAKTNFNAFKTLEKVSTGAGLKISKNRCPLGVVGIIYESRPNVTADAIAICLKSQNVCLLKGSQEAEFSNKILILLMHQVLQRFNLPANIVYFVGNTRQDTLNLITAEGIVDVCIARGSHELIKWVRQNASVPFIETGAGVVHIYVDETFDLQIAAKTIFNSKMRRVSVCNSLDCIVIAKNSLSFLAQICEPLLKAGVKIYAEQQAMENLPNNANIYLATQEHFCTEFLSPALAIKVMANVEEAIEHINKHSGRHSEAIITNNKANAAKFLKMVDSSAVYHNTATAFTDGGCFGMASEMGISTQKLHTRGPFSLHALTTYKWCITSKGRVRG